MKRMTEEQLRDYLNNGSKGEEIAAEVGSIFRRVLFTPLSVLCGVLSVICRCVGAVSSLLWLPGIYYAFKTVAAFNSGNGLFYGGYFKIAAAFLIFPFIAMFISVAFRLLRDFFSIRAY